MRSIPAREIKRRGTEAVDELVKEGPVYIIKNDRPCYVIMDLSRYEDLLEDLRDAEVYQTREALEDMKAGRVRTTTAQELIDEFGLEREVDDADRSPR